MFASNQRFEVSGDEQYQLRESIKFAMKMASFGERFNTDKNDIVFQKAGNMFCLGVVSKDNSDESVGKWQRFQFDFDVDIIANIIWQFIWKQDYTVAEDTDHNGYDGSVDKGFIMRALDTEEAYYFDLDEVIDKMEFGFIYFKPFNSFYAK